MAIERVNDNHPSAAEQARQADRKKTSNKDNAATSYKASQTASQQTQRTKSAFEQMMDNLGEAPHAQQEQTNKFDSRLKETSDQKEQGGKGKERSDRSERKEDKKDRSSLEGESRSHRSSSAQDGIGEQKVLGKQDSGQGKSGGGDSGGSKDGGGNSGGQFGQRSFRSSTPDATLSPVGLRGISEADKLFSAQSAQLSSPQPIPKPVLDQLVNKILVGKDRFLNQQIQVELKEFKGLSLQVKLVNGKVLATFITSDPSIKRLFDAQKGEINQALKEKNVVALPVQVQLLG